MRISALTLIAAAALAASALTANAAPNVPPPARATSVVAAAWGCGPGAHPNRWGRCVPNRYGYWRRPHWRGYYGGGYRWWWGSPSDHVANQLNRRQLYGY